MKASKRDARVYLEDIRSAIERIESYTTAGKQHFFEDNLTQDAVIRQLEIVGEATTKLPPALKSQHPEIAWKKVIGMRNILIHDYSRTNLDRVWEVVERDLAPLKKTIDTLLREQAA